MIVTTAPTLHFLQTHHSRMLQLFALNQVALMQSGVLSVVSDFAASRKARRAVVWQADLINLQREVEVALIGQWDPVLNGERLGMVNLELTFTQTPKHIRNAKGMNVSHPHHFGGQPADHVLYRNVLENVAAVTYQFLATGMFPHYVDYGVQHFVY